MEDMVTRRERGLGKIVVEKFHSIRELDGAGVCCDYPLAPVIFK